jgi:alpha-galactosidase/6-phospho-beta-glucosidase family protein
VGSKEEDVKITIIGGGSFFFTRQMLKRVAASDLLCGAHIALVEADPGRRARVGPYAEKYARETGDRFTVSSYTDRREALEGSQYVVLTFAANNVHSRGVGVHICQNYGIREASGDTAGPGSLMRIIREVPAVLAVARDIEELCPDAWVINYVNPTNVITAALMRHTKVRCMGFCDGMHLPIFGKRILELAGITPAPEKIRALDLRIGGINHFGWMTGLSLDGKDLWPRFVDGLHEQAAKPGAKPLLQAESELCRMFDAWPTCAYHGIEYTRYFQGRGSIPSRDFVITPWSLDTRITLMREFWRNVDGYNAGRMQRAEAFTESRDDGEMLGDVIESVEGDLHERFPVNVPNGGLIPNLPPEAIVEVFSTIGKDGPTPFPQGPMPRGPLGMTCAVLDQQELGLEAAMTASAETLVRAIACDPLVMSLRDARDIARELMAAEEEFLDPRWDSFWARKGEEAR